MFVILHFDDLLDFGVYGVQAKIDGRRILIIEAPGKYFL